ncbi:CBS domain-containing membrane protein [Pseudomonas sp. TE3786]
MFAAWLSAFLPAASNTRPTEWLRAAYGAALAVFACTWACGQLFGAELAAHLLGPLGASAVLLFAVSSGALAQPWSIVGSYAVATLMAVLTLHFVGGGIAAAALAVAGTLVLMCLLRCLHPPGAALTICLVLGGPHLTSLGWQLFYPALFNALALLSCALLYNNLSGVRYPKRPAAAPHLHATQDPLPEERVGITSADLDDALNELGGFVDIQREDLKQIIRTTEKNALRRSMGAICAEQIMSRDVQTATPQTTVKQALELLRHHHLKTLPVLDEQRHLVGIVSLIDLVNQRSRPRRRNLLGQRREVVLEAVMSHPVTVVQRSTHVVEMIPLLSDQGLHCLPVLDKGELLGIVTQTDLIAALHRDLLMHLG